HDLPEPHEQLPPDVFPVPFIYVCKFNARCELDLKQIAFGIRHAEYNPRKHSSITVRLFNPRVTALIRASGAITLSANAGCASEDDLKRSAKKLARLIQRCGHDGAKFADFAVTSILCKATLGFPVRLDVLASRFRKNALYEPEFFCSCVFRTRQSASYSLQSYAEGRRSGSPKHSVQCFPPAIHFTSRSMSCCTERGSQGDPTQLRGESYMGCLFAVESLVLGFGGC
ncbi:tbpA, partial [Symbiodinium necroappetens]